MAVSAGIDPHQLLADAGVVPDSEGTRAWATSDRLSATRSIVILVVDGLGHANLKAAAGHARTLTGLPTKRIETVLPSTTGAALTTLTTGMLPGEHGLIGYKIRHPELGLLTTLRDWEGIEDPRTWQRGTPLFELAPRIGAKAVAIGRPAHASGGLTEAILSGTEYHSGQTIEERFSIASTLVRDGEPKLVYLYVDELDRAAHNSGWLSDAWLRRLEQLDAGLEHFLRALPGEVGVVVTADHGMVDVPEQMRLLLDGGAVPLEDVELVGGEPRMRSLYLRPGADAEEAAAAIQHSLRKQAWVGTRAEAIAHGWFGPMSDGVAERLGDILIAARGQYAFMLSGDDAAVHEMVGQHGSLSDEERGIPLALAGSLQHSSFAAAVSQLAGLRTP